MNWEPLTLGHAVEHHSDLLIFTQTLFEVADEDAVGQVIFVHFKGFSIHAPVLKHKPGQTPQKRAAF